MSGLYIHIPFCASRCIYCDFYSTTQPEKSHGYVDALLKEFEQRINFIPNTEPLSTIYIGGGTPSQLPVTELKRLINSILAIARDKGLRLDLQEITIEVNPEDVSTSWAKELGCLNTNLISQLNKNVLRVSMGVQSMIDSELQILKRRHSRHGVELAVRRLRTQGQISNMSVDLIYGLPEQTIITWKLSIKRLLHLNPEHISAYCLSVENGTFLQKMVKAGNLSPADDELCIEMADVLREKLREAGYEQYEISNYSKPGYQSKHNSSYWDGTAYLGLGPGAHSYDGKRHRVWNEPNLEDYLKGIRKEDGETLTDKDLYNEKVMLGLRTSKGIDAELISNRQLPIHLRHYIEKKGNNVKLTEAGLALADEVIRELMMD